MLTIAPMGQKQSEREQTEETNQSKWGFRGMTVRDWLDLLVVPVVLSLIAVGFTWQQNERQQAVAEELGQAAALQAYLDQMNQLMLEEDLRDSEPGSDVRLLARARTVTVLQRLRSSPRNPETNKEAVVEFLSEAKLIQRSDGKDPVISLRETDLEAIDLDGEDLRGVILEDASLEYTNLRGADLEGANLERVDLKGANLEGANLEGANLLHVRGVTEEQLEQQAESLRGAMMPDGSKHP